MLQFVVGSLDGTALLKGHFLVFFIKRDFSQFLVDFGVLFSHLEQTADVAWIGASLPGAVEIHSFLPKDIPRLRPVQSPEIAPVNFKLKNSVDIGKIIKDNLLLSPINYALDRSS